MAANGYDAVVIGGGHNGLAAAIHMAKRGMSVLLLEQSDKVGGAIRTEEVTLPGFRHDLYAMNLSLFAGSPFAREHGAALARHGFATVAARDCFATAFPDGRWLGISADLETNVARIARFSEEDAATWRRLTETFPQDVPLYAGILSAPMTTRALFAFAWRAVRQRGVVGTLEAARLLLSSPREFLDETYRSEHVKAVCAPWALHLDFAPDVSGGALFPYLEGLGDQAFGMALGQGGADVVPRSMAGYLAELGGTIRTGTPVASVEVSAGRATAVRLEGGERIAARTAIVASVTPSGLLALLGGSTGQPRLDARLRAFRHGPGTLMIHLATSALPPWAAGEELSRFAYVHLAPDLHTLSATYAEAMAGLLPRAPAIVVGQPTAVDPSRAPAGQHTLWLQVRVVPSVIAGDAAGEIAPGSWDERKEAMADRVMAIVEQYAPGLSGLVLARTVHSPDDLERANPNLVGGDSIGGSHHLRQNFVFRPAPGMAHHRTPVAGLYMTGASTWPGAGVGAGSGTMVGQLIAGR